MLLLLQQMLSYSFYSATIDNTRNQFQGELQLAKQILILLSV